MLFLCVTLALRFFATLLYCSTQNLRSSYGYLLSDLRCIHRYIYPSPLSLRLIIDVAMLAVKKTLTPVLHSTASTGAQTLHFRDAITTIYLVT